MINSSIMDNNETDLTIIESGVSVAMTPEGNISKMKEDCTPDCTPDAFHDVATLVKAKPIAVDVGTPGANTPQYIVYPCATPDTTSTDGGSDTSSVREDSPIITNATVLLADCDSPYSTSSIDQLASSHTPAGAKVTWKPIASAMKSDAPKTPLTARKIKVVKASSGTKLLPPFLLKELKDDDHITTVQNLFDPAGSYRNSMWGSSPSSKKGLSSASKDSHEGEATSNPISVVTEILAEGNSK